MQSHIIFQSIKNNIQKKGRRYRLKFIWILISLLFFGFRSYSQNPDTTTIIQNDTTIQLIHFGGAEKRLEGKKIEDILKHYSDKNLVSRKLHEWLVKSSIEESKTGNNSSPTDIISKYKGQKIQNIDIRHIQPFGGSVNDTVSVADSWIARVGNKLRFETAPGVIFNTITFKKGEVLSLTDVTDSERLLRSFSFINDVKIVAWPHPYISETINISIYVQDRYPHAVSLGLTDQNPSFTVVNKNLFGRGFSLSNSLVAPDLAPSTWGFREIFGAENILGEYLNFEIDYSHTENLELIGGHLKKDFVLPEIKYAGEVSFNRSFVNPKIKEHPAVSWEPPLNYRRQNFWLGRSFMVNNPEAPLRSNIYLTARFLEIDLFNSPDFPNILSEGKFYYAGMAFSRRGYYKNNLIYSFGRTEDVPYGMLTSLSFGYHQAPGIKRPFLSFHYSSGRTLIPSKGYLYFSGDIGSYFNQGAIREGFLKLSGEYISPLINVGQSKLRSFLELQYVSGLNRKEGEFLFIDEEVKGLHRFEYKNTIRGSQKAVFKTEQVFFTRMEPLGFKFAFFTFFDTAFLKESGKHSLFQHVPYFSFGGGLRIRNDNLVFNTLQIRLSIMPRVPENELPFSFRTTGESVKNFRDFVPTQPGSPVYY